MMFVAVAIAYLAAAGTQPATTAAATSPVQGMQTAAPAKEKKVCTSEVVSGSIMPKRVCRTKAEADAEAKDAARRSIELPARQGGRN